MRKPQTPPTFKKLMGSLATPERLFTILQAVSSPTNDGRYPHWDELRHRKPPEGLTHEDWWLGLKMRRQTGYRAIPLKDTAGENFHFTVPDLVTEFLHQIDRGGGTFVEIPEQVTNAEQRDRYVVRSLMEEAITSSQLEGAATTREVAKKMLAEGRKPRDRSERMIVNNYVTMQRILELKEMPLTTEMVFQVHRGISEDALDIPDGAGRFRGPDEDINVSDIEGTVFHTPPLATELPARLEAMCDFARKAPVQYGTAFLHTETDGNDLTYFLIHQAEIIRRALKGLHDYVARKSSETRACLDALQKHPELNHRQQSLISHAVRHPGFVYNIAGHGARHAVVYQTARTDLLSLAKLGLLGQRKAGRALVFVAPKDLESRLRSKSS